MGWRLIKGWETPRNKVEPQEMVSVNRVWECRTTNGFGIYFNEYDMMKAPNFFQFTPDLPEGWVRPEDTDAEYGLGMDADGGMWFMYRTVRGAWRQPGSQSDVPGSVIKAIYPLQKPKI